jgi:peptidoglycan/LPS O-acetylase OafA/YrhL
LKSPNVPYLRGVDHLRAFAATLVVFFHGVHWLRHVEGGATDVWVYTKNPLLALAVEGETAVGLFMVLSGFIFSCGAVQHDVAYWPFIRNRVLRIYPLFVVVTLVATAAHPMNYSFSAVLQTLFLQADNGGAFNGGNFTSMFWSVAVELQFYLIFPFLHREVERKGVKWVAAAILLFNILRGTAFMGGTSTARAISYYHLVGRIDEFLLGMLVARTYLKHRTRNLPWGWFSLGALCLVVASAVVVNSLGGFQFSGAWTLQWPTLEGALWALVILVYVPFAERLQGPVSNAIARLGTWSFSIYLLHPFLILILPRYIPFDPEAGSPTAACVYVALVLLPATIPLSALSYYVVEQPFLSLRQRYLVSLVTETP